MFQVLFKAKMNLNFKENMKTFLALTILTATSNTFAHTNHLVVETQNSATHLLAHLVVLVPLLLGVAGVYFLGKKILQKEIVKN